MLQKKVYIATITFVSLVLGANIWVFIINNPSYTTIAPRLPNAPEYVCSDDLPASVCAQLKLTCGNGVNDPFEDCRNCVFDKGCPSGLICGDIGGSEEYICHYPAGLCSPGPGV